MQYLKHNCLITMAVFTVVVGLILLLSVCVGCQPVAKEIFVDGQMGKDGLPCVENGAMDKPCLTLEYVAEHIRSANISGPVDITIKSATLSLSKSVTFESIHRLTIRGNGTMAHCRREGGIKFMFVTQLEIRDLALTMCGLRNQNNFSASIHIQNCTNVFVVKVSVTMSQGAGLLLFDTHGKVSITACSFTGSGHAAGIGSGLYIRFTHCPVKEGRVYTKYRVDSCIFANNSVHKLDKGSGGGLKVVFKADSCFNDVTIADSNFTQNQAFWGGGLSVSFKESPHENNVTVSRTMFVANKALQGAGGVQLGYYSNNDQPQTHFQNRIHFQDTLFYKNRARYAGGIIIFSRPSTSRLNLNGTVSFNNCTWLENAASFSSAVDISPHIYDVLSNGFFPIPIFTDCRFVSNQQLSWTRNANAGSFLVTKFTVKFAGEVVFKDHMHSALQATSGTIEFEAGSDVHFVNNTGVNGGAMSLYGFSLLRLHDNSVLKFIGNTAIESGGAIYHHSYDQHDFISTRTCFIQHTCSRHKPCRNSTVVFSKNRATRAGNSIFSLSFYPCYYQFYKTAHKHTTLEVFGKIGQFNFDKNDINVFGTEGNKFHPLQEQETVHAVPGKPLLLPIDVRDELNHTISTLYRIDTTEYNKDGKVIVDRSYTANGIVKLFGGTDVPVNGSLSLFSVSFRQITTSIKVTILDCPPGYFYQHQNDGKHNYSGKCECAAYYQEHAYLGIGHCNSTLFRAYIERGYWAGYPNAEHITPEGLHTAPCHRGFCSYEFESEGPLYLLPNVSSNLDDWMCGQYRTGILCGRCEHSLSVYYHSQQYRCASSKNCGLGVLFYILSEIFPLTVLFTTVVVFDIRFTSGTLNGFVFFSQVLDTLSIDANGAIKFPRGVEELSIGYSVLYGLLNFDFFSIESLSFCLWEGATVLDIVAFKYVTVAFALILVVSLVTIMRWCNCQRLCRIKRKISTKDSVIHGLTAFLVMCYTQCTRVSFQILTAVRLTGEGGHSDSLVTYFGGIPYLGTEHLSYAIPALLCVTTIVAIPPIVLLVFPLYNHILVWCGITENKKCNWLSRFLLVNKLKPVLDSFQGCFKDNFRLFAGLYFVYRVAIMAAYTFSTSALQFYFIIEVLLVFMLWLQATAQPYISRLHNVVDSIMFGSLALINAFTVYNYYFRLATPDFKVDAVFWIQLVLIYLPLTLVAIFIIGQVARMLPRRHTTESPPEASVNFSLDSVDNFIDHDRLPYQEFEVFRQLTREASPPDTRPNFGIDSY